jgi:molybdopterin converting factor subunit 1
MTHRVRLFARVKDLAGADAVTVELPPGSTVGELRRRLGEGRPALAGLLSRCAVAVNDEFAEDSLMLPAECDIALLPPVSGGATFPV